MFEVYYWCDLKGNKDDFYICFTNFVFVEGALCRFFCFSCLIVVFFQFFHRILWYKKVYMPSITLNRIQLSTVQFAIYGWLDSMCNTDHFTILLIALFLIYALYPMLHRDFCLCVSHKIFEIRPYTAQEYNLSLCSNPSGRLVHPSEGELPDDH